MLFEKICGGKNLWPIEKVEYFYRDGVKMAYVYDKDGYYINRADHIIEASADDVIKVVGNVYRLKKGE